MKQVVTAIQWTCDNKKCKAHTTSEYDRDTPPGWITIDGAMQTPSGGGPAYFDLCPKHSALFHKMFDVHTDTDEDD